MNPRKIRTTPAGMSADLGSKKSRPASPVIPEAKPEDVEPDWTRKCEVCQATPIVPATGMCGPCTFGEADTAEGNW